MSVCSAEIVSLGRGEKIDLKQTCEVSRWGEEKGANASCQIMTFQVIYTSPPVFWTSAPALNSYLRTWNWQPEQEPRPAVGWAASPLPRRAGSKGETICCKETCPLPHYFQLHMVPGWYCSLLGNASDGELKLHLFLAKRSPEEVLI